MSKYIVKNCELICNGECPNSKTGFCEDCTDCLIKQVIEKCKEHVDSLCPCPDEGKSCIECTIAEEEYIACQLIQLFEIEDFTESETRLSEGNVNGRTKSEVKDLPERE